MALPDGVTTATVTAGVPVTHTGGQVKAFLSIEPSAFLVHTATGTPLVDFIEDVDISAGTTGYITLPHTDQTGFQDESGNAYTNWHYTARITYSTPSRAKTKPPKVKVFQLASGQTVVDLDKLPGGAPALPYTAPIATVTSVAGLTGSVTGGQIAALPELSATIGDKVTSASGLPAWAGTSRPNTFDRTRSTYNWKASNTRKTTAALAKAISGGAGTFAAIGDSETLGAFVYWFFSYPKRALDALVAAGYPLKGYVSKPPLTFPNDGWTATGTVSMGSAFATLSNAATVTYTSTHTGTIAEVSYFNSGGAFTVTIDGGAPVTVTPTGAANVGKYTVTGLSSATHAVKVTATANNVWITGIAVRQTFGIEFNNWGANGATAASAAGGLAWEDQAFAKLQHTAINSGPTTDTWFVALGVNDVRFPLTDAVIKAALSSIITKLKATSSADVILVSEMQPTQQTDSTAIPQARWDSFMSMYYDLADLHDIPLIDVSYAFGTPAQALTLGTSSGDNVPHPSAAGYALKGRVVAKALL